MSNIMSNTGYSFFCFKLADVTEISVRVVWLVILTVELPGVPVCLEGGTSPRLW